MNTTDPIADMLTRIRNANSGKCKTVDVPKSKMKRAIAEILLNEGYIKSYEDIDNDTQGVLRISLKYASKEELPKVLNGLGIAIISTPKGIMTDRDARKNGVGGEVLAYVW